MEQEMNLAGRIQSIIKLAKHWRDTMPKKPRKKGEGPKWREWTGLITVLEKFLEFANDYQKLLKIVPFVNQGFVVNRGSENLLRGFNILSRACEQRRGIITTDSLGYYLAQAEDVLEQYCNRWRGGELTSPYLNLITPVVYFEKLYGVTRSVYAPQVPVVSIPLTMYNNSDLWLALAHEMGHHIFWNALDSFDEVEKFQNLLYETVKKSAYKESADVWGGWAEEIFADVSGVLLTGTPYVVSSQDATAEQIRVPNDFSKNDGVHPSPYLRPLIAAQVLREVADYMNDDDLRNVLVKIEQRWKDFSQEASKQLCGGTQFTLTDLAAEVKPIVRAILHEALWPNKKKLWDLIIFYGKEPLTMEERRLIQNLNTLPLLPSKPGMRLVQITGPRDSDIPTAMKEIWHFLNGRLISSNIPDTEKPAAQWKLLLELSLDDFHGHAVTHTTYCDSHWYAPWAGNHIHDPQTTIWASCT